LERPSNVNLNGGHVGVVGLSGFEGGKPLSGVVRKKLMLLARACVAMVKAAAIAAIAIVGLGPLFFSFRAVRSIERLDKIKIAIATYCTQ